MNFAEVIPRDITALPRYSVPQQLFICTAILLLSLLLLALFLAVQWSYRAYHGYTNTDYLADYAVKLEADLTMRKIAQEQQTPEDREFLAMCRKYSRMESRWLEFACMVVLVAVNVGTYTCTAMEIVCFLLTLITFTMFNVYRMSENKVLRVLWLLPLLGCYLPFYIFPRALQVG